MRLLLYIGIMLVVGYFLLWLGELGIVLLLLMMATAVFYGVHLLHDLHRHFIPPTTPEDRVKTIVEQYKQELANKESQL